MLEYDDKTHTYYLDGSEIKSVTQLLQDVGLMSSKFFTEEGANNGKRRHAVTELYDKEVLDWESVLEEDLPYLQAWIYFKKDYNVKIQAIEQRIYHPLLGYAGTIDRLAEVKNVPTVIDIKTGAKNKDNELQLILYGLMVENTGQKPNLMTVYIKKNGKYSVEEYDYKNERIAMSVIRVSQWKRR